MLEDFDMNNLSSGVMNFKAEVQPPNFSKIPVEEIIGKIYLK